MSEFKTSHLHFRESGQKQDILCPKLVVSLVKVANKVSHFTSKQPISGREFLFLATFLYFKLKFTLCFVVKQEMKMMISFKFTHFAIFELD